MAMSCLTWKFAGFSSQRHGFDPRAVNVGFVAYRLFTKYLFSLCQYHSAIAVCSYIVHIALDNESSCYQMSVRVLV